MIYLDNSATTYPKPKELYEALDYANRNLAFNAGRGSYKEATDAAKIIDDCRKAVSLLAQKSPLDVAFLSSATESLNLIINGLDLNPSDVIYISPFEHNAIVRPLLNLKDKIGFELLVIPFNSKTWDFDQEKLEEMFSIKRPKAVFLSQISNVTGYILPYKEIFKLAKKYNSVTVLDSSQSYGVLNPDLSLVDYCVFAGHKSLYASFGVAGIISSSFSKLSISKSGGTGSDSLNYKMPESGHGRLESGSPNVIAIYGLLKSCEWLKNKDVFNHERHLTEYLINRLEEIDKITIYLPTNKDNILGIVSFNVEGYLSDDVASILYDEFNIAVRSGYHCSPMVHEFIDSLRFKGTVRASIGAFNTKEDIDTLVNALKTL